MSHLGFDRSGSRLFTVATGEGYYSLGGLGIWEVPTGRRLGEFSGADAVITLDKFALLRRPGVVLKAGSGHLRRFDDLLPRRGPPCSGSRRTSTRSELSPDGRRLVVGIGSFEPRGDGSGKGAQSSTTRWRAGRSWCRSGTTGSVLSVAFSPDGRLVLTGEGTKLPASGTVRPAGPSASPGCTRVTSRTSCSTRAQPRP